MKLHLKVRQNILIISLVVLFLFTSTLPAQAVAINSDIGLTPYKGQIIIRSQFRALRKSSNSRFLNGEAWILSNPNTAVYGFTEKLSGFVTVPWIYKNPVFESPSGKIRRKAKGIGDITLLTKYRIFTKDFTASTSRLALLGGIELPTGEIGDSDKFGKLPRPLQDGSGSWDPITGFAFTHQTLNDEWDLNLTYKFNTERSNFEFGDVLKYNLAYQKRVLPRKIPNKGTYKQVNFVLEANGIWAQKNQENDSRVRDSGNNAIFLSPGVQFVTKHVIAEFSVQLPVLRRFRGNQLKPDVSLVSSLRLTF